MAMGIYVGAGSVKTVSSIYVGADGVKTVKEVYVGAGGVKKVWPAYTDYGNDVDLLADGYVTYGYWMWNSSYNTSRYQGNSAGTTDASTSTGYNRCYLNDPDDDFGAPAYHWFPTQQAIDLRGYNYLCAYVSARYNKAGSAMGSTADRINPFFSIGTSATSRPDGDTKYVQSSTTFSTDFSVYVYIFVDLTNCTSESAYLKVGGYLTTTYSGTSYALWGWMTASYINLYKEKSDCTIDPGSSNAVYLSY